MADTNLDKTSLQAKAEASPSAMQIKSIKIKNFRSYQEVELNCSSFNILVGRNNHGKSNFIEALEWFYTGKAPIGEIRRRNSGHDNPIEVEITFSNVQMGLEEVSNETNKTKILKNIGSDDEMTIRRTSEKPKQRQLWNSIEDKWVDNPFGGSSDSPFNNCIPRFEFVHTSKNLKEVAAYKSTSPIGQLLSGLLQSVLSKDESSDFRDFLKKFDALFGEKDPDTGSPSAVRAALNQIGDNVKGHLVSQFPDCKDVSFDISPPEPEDLLKGYTTTLDDGVITSAQEKGDGMQRALMLAIIKAHADFRRQDAVGRSFIFFIDEAELHLHPTAQRQLKESLIELAKSQDQVFITTHSSVFIADTHDEQSLFAVQKEESITAISKIDKKPELQDTIFELLGGHPADLLLPPNFLIVEGKSEQIFISSLIKRFYQDKPNIKIIAAAGDDRAASNTYDAVHKMLSISDGRAVYGDKIIVLLDKPDPSKEARLETFKSANPALESSGRLFILPTDTLEDYYPSDLSSECSHSKKVKKARCMAEHITQEQFQDEMEVILRALSKCWELAFRNDGGNHVSST